jgi:hypothetical protein
MGRTEFGWLRIGPVVGFCEDGYEPSYSIKTLFDKLIDCQLFKEYLPPWSKFYQQNICRVE